MSQSSPSTSPLHRALADIVTADPRAAAVFDRRGLDYCCHGRDTLADAAARHGLDAGAVLAELAVLGPAEQAGSAEDAWTQLDELTSHIVARHHAYVRNISPVLSAWLEKLVTRHGQGHPELLVVRNEFEALRAEMGTHMMKEENILFPYIDALAVAARGGGRLPRTPFGTVVNPIRVMEDDHREAGEALERLRRVTADYAAPADACTTYRLCYAELAKYEADLHRHVHLENHVLFPKAVELEERLA